MMERAQSTHFAKRRSVRLSKFSLKLIVVGIQFENEQMLQSDAMISQLPRPTLPLERCEIAFQDLVAFLQDAVPSFHSDPRVFIVQHFLFQIFIFWHDVSP